MTRLFDIRANSFKPSAEFNTGVTFAQSIDLKGDLMITSHRGFNQSGSDIKMWSLKKLNEPIFIFSQHSATPTANFLKDSSETNIISAG